MNKKYYMLLLCSIIQPMAAQDNNALPDSLQYKDYDYLFERIESKKTDDQLRNIYLEMFLRKAKKEENWEELSNAYKNYVHYAQEKLKLVYADSMVIAASKSGDGELMGSAYLSKGIAFYGFKRMGEALDCYVIANRYITGSKDTYLIHKVKYNMALIKYYLGYYEDAITLFRECIVYLKREDPRGYLNSLHSLGLCYNKSGNYGLCSQINNRGFKECKRLSQPDMRAYFLHSEGINHCSLHNYTMAIEKLKESLQSIGQNKDFANRTVGNFYIGKCYWELGRKDQAVPYLQKVDQAFRQRKYIRPDLREGYELLISYYIQTGNPVAQLRYVEGLLAADKLLFEQFRYLAGKISKEYDTHELKQEKLRIEKALWLRRYNDYIFGLALTILLVFILWLSFRFARSKKNARARYEALLIKLEEPRPRQEKQRSDTDDIGISTDTIASVLPQLDKFEKSRKFLEKDLSLMKLALYLGTNTNYLSKIIAHYRQKSFPEYINDLRIDHIAERIKNDTMLQKYTNKALADEAGFSTTRRFTNAFTSRTGITPTFFIDQLQKEKFD